jgi:nitroreductase/NAD-dependent dihydropyrimidine dehydrogenase PreA subunit
MDIHATLPAAIISINEEICQKDGICSQICPNQVFTGDSGEQPRIGDVTLCNLCGQCLSVCPTGAINHSRLNDSRLDRIVNHHPVDSDALGQLLRQRRSVRAYRDREIPQDLLEQLVAVAGFGPTGSHGGEGWVRRVVIVTGKDNMSKVAELTFQYMKQLATLLDSFVVRMVARWKESPRTGRLMLPDITMRLREFEKGHDVITYDAPAAVFVHSPRLTPTPQTDCDCVMYPMMLMAHALGLGTCWNGYLSKAASGFRIDSFTALRKLLEIPDHHDVYAAATLGFPRIRLHSVPQRNTETRFL